MASKGFRFQGQVELPNGVVVDDSHPDVRAFAAICEENGVPSWSFQILTERMAREIGSVLDDGGADFDTLASLSDDLRDIATANGIPMEVANAVSTDALADQLIAHRVELPDDVPAETREFIASEIASFHGDDAAKDDADAEGDDDVSSRTAERKAESHIAEDGNVKFKRDAEGNMVRVERRPDQSRVRELEKKQAALYERLERQDPHAEAELQELAEEWEALYGNSPSGSSQVQQTAGGE